MANKVLIKELIDTCELYQTEIEVIEHLLQSARDMVEKIGKDITNKDIDNADMLYTIKLRAVNEVITPLKEKRECLLEAFTNASRLGAFESANGDSSKEDILRTLLNMELDDSSEEDKASNK